MNSNTLFEMINEQLVFVSVINTPFINYRYIAMRYKTLVWPTGWETFHIKNARYDAEADFGEGLRINTVSILNDSMISINCPLGVFVYSMASRTRELYLPDESVSQTCIDKEGNLWFCTLNHGVFMLNSRHIYNIALRNHDGVKVGAYSLAKYGNDWLVGSDMSYLFLVKKISSGDGYDWRRVWMYKDSIPERVTSVLKDYDGGYWVGTDARMGHLDSQLKEIGRIDTLWGVKTIFRQHEYLLVATGRNVFRTDAAKGRIKDTLWTERSTIAIEKKDTIYIGTLDGLFIRLKDGSIKEAAPGIPQLRNRIMDIRQDRNGALWIATYAGVFCFNDGRIISTVTEKNGLVNNVCRTLDIFNDELWVGTNKGLQKVNIADTRKPVVEYLLSNELSSDIINYVMADSTNIVVATPEGLSIV
ncbi:MAG TPA: two-component regulator propeller domain-containing protein, partial [Chitinophagaceae bacterium]|nr:two-component regulator propeller domain-containing protein [Chitinophagaceae bacterium]